jgi:hypothetical protein
MIVLVLVHAHRVSSPGQPKKSSRMIVMIVVGPFQVVLTSLNGAQSLVVDLEKAQYCHCDDVDLMGDRSCLSLLLRDRCAA